MLMEPESWGSHRAGESAASSLARTKRGVNFNCRETQPPNKMGILRSGKAMSRFAPESTIRAAELFIYLFPFQEHDFCIFAQ